MLPFAFLNFHHGNSRLRLSTSPLLNGSYPASVPSRACHSRLASTSRSARVAGCSSTERRQTR